MSITAGSLQMRYRVHVSIKLPASRESNKQQRQQQQQLHQCRGPIQSARSRLPQDCYVGHTRLVSCQQHRLQLVRNLLRGVVLGRQQRVCFQGPTGRTNAIKNRQSSAMQSVQLGAWRLVDGQGWGGGGPQQVTAEGGNDRGSPPPPTLSHAQTASPSKST